MGQGGEGGGRQARLSMRTLAAIALACLLLAGCAGTASRGPTYGGVQVPPLPELRFVAVTATGVNVVDLAATRARDLLVVPESVSPAIPARFYRAVRHIQ